MSKVLQEFVVAVRFDVIKNEVDAVNQAQKSIASQAEETQERVGDANFKMAQEQAATYKLTASQANEHAKKAQQEMYNAVGAEKKIKTDAYKEAAKVAKEARKLEQQERAKANKQEAERAKQEVKERLKAQEKADQEVEDQEQKKIDNQKKMFALSIGAGALLARGVTQGSTIFSNLNNSVLQQGKYKQALGLSSTENYLSLVNATEQAGGSGDATKELIQQIGNLRVEQKENYANAAGISYKEGEAPDITAHKVIQGIIALNKGVSERQLGINANTAQGTYNISMDAYKMFAHLQGFDTQFEKFSNAYNRNGFEKAYPGALTEAQTNALKEATTAEKTLNSGVFNFSQEVSMTIANAKLTLSQALGDNASAIKEFGAPVAEAVVGTGISALALKLAPKLFGKGWLGTAISFGLGGLGAFGTSALFSKSASASERETQADQIAKARKDSLYLQSLGMNKYDAADQLAGGIYESGLNERAKNPTSTAYGTYQWTKSSGRQDLFERVEGVPLELSTHQQQLHFGWWERTHNYKDRLDKARAAGPNEPIFSRIYEAGYPEGSPEQRAVTNRTGQIANEILGYNHFNVVQNFHGQTDANDAKQASVEAFHLISRTTNNWFVG